jgi:putative oxidoreductase
MKPLFLIGRIIFGGFFLYNGINHLRQRRILAHYAGSKHVPAPHAGVVISGLMLVAGGASIALGLKPKLGSAAIIAFLAGASPTMHDFWRAEDPGQRMADLINFSKNLALLGAALALMGTKEPWPASVPVPRRTANRVRRLVTRLAA